MKLASFILALLLAGCASSAVEPLQPLEIATVPYQGIPKTALTGSLLFEGGCLLFRDDSNHLQLFPVWPDGSSFNGSSVIFHEPGKADQLVALAEEFVMAGRPVPWSGFTNPRMALHRRHCGSAPFAVLGIRPAN